MRLILETWLYILSWRTGYALTWWLSWCLFLSLLCSSGNKPQTKPVMNKHTSSPLQPTNSVGISYHSLTHKWYGLQFSSKKTGNYLRRNNKKSWTLWPLLALTILCRKSLNTLTHLNIFVTIAYIWNSAILNLHLRLDIECVYIPGISIGSWWRHQMEIVFALLAFCAGNSSVTGEFHAQRPVTRSFDVFLICGWIHGWVNNHKAGDLRRHRTHYDVIVI